MPQLLETIRCQEGIVYNLPYHQKRVDKSRLELGGLTDKLDLSSFLTPPDKGLYRCRVLYAKTVHSIEYLPYTPKSFHTLKIVPSLIDYQYKYADRSGLETLLHAHPEADDILIEQNGFITDTTIANVAFFDGEKWLTPKKPLLEGTMRARLLDEGFLVPVDIRSNELENYQQVALINAMLGFTIINPKIISADN